MKVDLDGLPERIGVLPLPPSDYHGLTSVGDRLYYCRTAGPTASPSCWSTISRNGRRPSWAT